MKKKTWYILGAIALFFVALAVIAYLTSGALETTMEIQVIDAVSEGWVWDATITVQDRIIRSFYQTDQGPKPLELTGLRPGRSTVEVVAPHYQGISVPVRLRRGANRLEDPIRVQGLEIPDLRQFYVIANLEGGALTFEIRPVNSAGSAVLNHPCLDIWLGVLVSAQMKDGAYVQKSQDTGSTRGEPLFAGPVDWTWDGTPETSFRYAAQIPVSSLASSPARFWVVDALIVVPKPTEIERSELDGLMEAIYTLGSPEAVSEYLDRHTDRLSYYFAPTSWNVEGVAR
jgi:hypothetical protein